MKLLSKLFSKSTLQNLKVRKQRGASAVEFAFVAPVMIAMLFGSTEASQAVSVDRKVTLAASTIADLVAQGSTLDCATLTAAVSVTREVFAPYNGVNAEIVVASVALVGGTPKIEWSRVVNSGGSCSTAAAYPVGTAVTVAGVDGSGNPINLATAMIPTDGAIILGDVRLSYTSLGTSFFPSGISMQERFFLRPRKSDKVCFDGVVVAGC
ncbi:MAG: hypothetical protein FD163_1486 [Hyphomonadaceae bacterium]|nr:MAG: hypothetical protein FD128_1232 [Hyphomonadaceae bacterium]KAF0184789.1 MAG: hypothetical protein FD163_1486 [Hyphomonadaceae bacterium]